MKKARFRMRGAMKEMWDALNAIFDIGGIVTVVFGGSLLGTIVWITRKPKVYLLSQQIDGWYFTYKKGVHGDVIDQVYVLLHLNLENRGREETTISGSFDTSNNNIAFLR